MDWRPITLHSCSHAEVDFANRVLSITGGKAKISLGGREYHLHVTAHGDDYRAIIVLRCRVGDGSLSIYLNELALGSLLANLVPPSSFRTLPEDLQLALLSAAVFPLADALREQLQLTFAIERFELLSGTTASGLLWEITPAQEAVTHSILLVIGDPLPVSVMDWLRSMGQAAVAKDYAGLTLPVDLQAGHVSLKMSDIESLKFGDIMLMSVSYVSEGRLRVSIGNYFSCLAQIEGDNLIVRTKLEKTMEEESNLSEGMDEAADTSLPDAAPVASVEKDVAPREDKQVVPDVSDLPMNVLFVAGRFNVTLEELRNIQPGYVFDLRKDARQEIEIRINGTEIAKGELVEVDGRTGVRVVECK